MDRRLEIFSLWRNPIYESTRQRIQSLNNIIDILDDVNLANYLGMSLFKCFHCEREFYISKNCVTWIIAADPIKYLMEDERLLCRQCTEEMKHGTILFRNILRIPTQGQKVMDVTQDTRINHKRYVYNTKYKFYIEIENVSRIEYKDRSFDRKLIVYRTLNPLQNPFFKIGNTLFTVLCVELQDYL